MVSIRRHPETGNPRATWRLVAGIYDEQLIETLSGLIDNQAKPGRIEAYLPAIPVIYQKTAQLLKPRVGDNVRFHFSGFETLTAEPKHELPPLPKGALRFG
jgi:hypothetical protein